MTKEQRTKIEKLRADGQSYGAIAQELAISLNTVKSYCRRNHLSSTVTDQKVLAETGTICKNCGKPLIQNAGRKKKKFCSDHCRNKWWNSHLDKVNRKAIYDYVCPYCKQPFQAYGNKNRRFCSHKCYIAFRFGGDEA